MCTAGAGAAAWRRAEASECGHEASRRLPTLEQNEHGLTALALRPEAAHQHPVLSVLGTAPLSLFSHSFLYAWHDKKPCLYVSLQHWKTYNTYGEAAVTTSD